MMTLGDPDLDHTLPNPRAENWKRKSKGRTEAAQKETGGEPDSQADQPPPDQDEANDKEYRKKVDNASVDIRKLCRQARVAGEIT